MLVALSPQLDGGQVRGFWNEKPHRTLGRRAWTRLRHVPALAVCLGDTSVGGSFGTSLRGSGFFHILTFQDLPKKMKGLGWMWYTIDLGPEAFRGRPPPRAYPHLVP